MFAFFLPAAGHRRPGTTAGELTDPGVRGNYWSSTQVDVDRGHFHTFGVGDSRPSYSDPSTVKSFGFNVRCVR